jgi:hypothetical protein
MMTPSQLMSMEHRCGIRKDEWSFLFFPRTNCLTPADFDLPTVMLKFARLTSQNSLAGRLKP